MPLWKACPLLDDPWDTTLKGGNPEIGEERQLRWLTPFCLCIRRGRLPGLRHQIPGRVASRNGDQWAKVSQGGTRAGRGLGCLMFHKSCLSVLCEGHFGVLAGLRLALTCWSPKSSQLLQATLFLLPPAHYWDPSLANRQFNSSILLTKSPSVSKLAEVAWGRRASSRGGHGCPI